MQIQSSLDWATVKAELRKETNKASMRYEHKMQAYKMIENIGIQVTALSNCELIFRRNPIAANIRTAEEHIAKINLEIHSLEQWIFMFLLAR